MNFEEAVKFLSEGDLNIIQENGNLYALGWYLSYHAGDVEACLDGMFSAEDLIAIGTYMQQAQQEEKK